MKAKKRPVEIEYFPCAYEYFEDILKWETKERPIALVDDKDHKLVIDITTLEGVHRATEKDMIIKGVNGEVYPCKKDIFAKTYDKLD